MKLRALLSLVVVVAVGAMGSGVAGAKSAATEYFTLTQTSFDDPGTIVALGPISATGTDEVLGRHRDDFVFPDGTLHIRHWAKSSHERYDAQACVFTFTEKGTYLITGGTGDYAGVSGSGRYSVVGRVAGCDPHEPPTSTSVVIQAEGPISLG